MRILSYSLSLLNQGDLIHGGLGFFVLFIILLKIERLRAIRYLWVHDQVFISRTAHNHDLSRALGTCHNINNRSHRNWLPFCYVICTSPLNFWEPVVAPNPKDSLFASPTQNYIISHPMKCVTAPAADSSLSAVAQVIPSAPTAWPNNSCTEHVLMPASADDPLSSPRHSSFSSSTPCRRASKGSKRNVEDPFSMGNEEPFSSRFPWPRH